MNGGVELINIATVLATIFLGGGLLGLPLSIPPLPPDPVIARAAPDECLAHVALAGIATPDAGSGNLTERMLADEEMREFLDRLARQLVAVAKDSARQEAALELVSAGLSRPLAVTIERFTLPADGRPPEVRASLLLRTGGGDGERRIAVAADAVAALATADAGGREPEERTIGTATVRQVPTPLGPLSWGVHDGSLVVTIGEGTLEALLKRIGDATRVKPAWMADAERRLPLDRPATLTYVNAREVLRIVSSLPMADRDRLAAFLAASGIAGIDRLVAVSGLDGEGMVTEMRLGFEGQPSGLFAAPASGIGPKQLARIPADAVMAQAVSLDPSRMLATVLDVIAATDGDGAAEIRRGLEQFRAVAGLDLDRHLLKTLGPDWTFVALPSAGGLLPNVAAIAGVRDHPTFAKTHKALLGVLRNLTANGETRTTITEIPYRGQTLFCLGIEGPDMAIPLTPTWCLTADRLLITLSPQLMKTLLARTDADTGLGTVAEVKEAMAGGGADFVGVLDPQVLLGSLCSAYELATPLIRQATARAGRQLDLPTLPRATAMTPFVKPSVTVLRHEPDGIRLRSTTTLPLGPLAGGGGLMGVSPASAPVLVGLLLPAVQSAREAGRRNTMQNNMKQVLIAMHMHVAAKDAFPPQAICDPEGKPLLSWRVTVLPYIGEEALFKEFHLDEPWDSEHNRALAPRMPAVFADPSADAEAVAAGLTTIQVLTGGNTLFAAPDQGVRLRDITDGMSNTLLIVEAMPDRAVPWTKPEDHPFDPERPTDGIGNPHRSGGVFLGGLCDGSVHAFNPDVDPDVFKALVTPAGGEPVQLP
jgi:hypothetical protein